MNRSDADASGATGLGSGNGGDEADDPARITPGRVGRPERLSSCNEHAVCYGYASGDVRYCRAVAKYYGGFGMVYSFNNVTDGVMTRRDGSYH